MSVISSCVMFTFFVSTFRILGYGCFFFHSRLLLEFINSFFVGDSFGLGWAESGWLTLPCSVLAGLVCLIVQRVYILYFCLSAWILSSALCVV